MVRLDKRFFERMVESWIGIKAREFLNFLLPKCQDILTSDELNSLLNESRLLKVKFVVTPLSQTICELTSVMLLRQFQRAGHCVNLVINDSVAKIESGSGKAEDMIEENVSTHIRQIGKLIDMSSLVVWRNSDWTKEATLSSVFKVFRATNLVDAMKKESLRGEGKGLSVAELCYGFIGGFDSIKLWIDVEIGRATKLMDFKQCRMLMACENTREETVLMTSLLEEVAAQANGIVTASRAGDKFGMVMSVPDRLIASYFLTFADVGADEIEELHRFIGESPFEAKKQLATFIVAMEFGLEKACEEREIFERRFSEKKISADDCIPVLTKSGGNFMQVLYESGLFESKSELRRLFLQGAVHLIEENDKIIKVDDKIERDCLIRVGKRMFFNVRILI